MTDDEDDQPDADRDPFEELGPGIDEREGDPFESLAETPTETAESGDDPSVASESDDEPTIASKSDDLRLDDHPFSDSDEGARKRRVGPEEDDPFAGMDVVPSEDPFESGDWATGGGDDSVWEDLSEPVEPETATTEEGGRRLSEVNKHSFCEQCEYFSGPPEIACGHEGTEILEFLDMETVRIADCPIVEERERLEEAGTQG